MSIYRRVTLQPDGSLRTTGPMHVSRGGVSIPLADGEVQSFQVDATRWLDTGETLTACTLAGATVTLATPRAVVTLTEEPVDTDLTLTTSAGRVRKITVNPQGTRYDYGWVT